MSEGPCCKLCKHFHEGIIDAASLKKVFMCRCFPPQVVVIPIGPGQAQAQGFHPPIKPDGLCGEFTPAILQ